MSYVQKALSAYDLYEIYLPLKEAKHLLGGFSI